jgi:arylsulfatase A-like enzyme
MTGQYPHNHGVRGNGDALQLDQSQTVQRYLHDAGYQTGLVGKFLNDWPVDQKPEDFDRAAVFDHGYLNTTWGIDGQVRTVKEYSTSFIRDQALADIRAFSADPSKPWYLYVATSAPHDPWLPEPKYANSPVPRFVRDPAMRERDVSDKPPWVSGAQHLPLSKIDVNRASQLRTLRSVDDMVQSLFAELGQLGEARNTLAIFLSDNGFLWGEHGLAGDKGEVEFGTPHLISGKRYPYLPSVRIPLLVRWPGHIRGGQVVDGFATTVDLAPTIMQAAGVAPPGDPPMDGSSLLTAGNTGPTAARRQAYMEYFTDPIYPDVPSWGSLLTHARHYIAWYDTDGRVIFREFYNLRKDPFELDNLLGNTDAADDPDVTSLDAELFRDRRCVGLTGSKACPAGSERPAP